MPQFSIRTICFMGSSRKDLRRFPNAVRANVGMDLYGVQHEQVPDNAKAFKGLRGVMEITHRQDTAS
jgi:phage-related protein